MTHRPRVAAVLSVALLLAATAASCRAATDGTEFRIKPADNAPAGPPGEVRRTIQPFEDWTLICDENLKKRTKICNVSQVIVDGAGATAFSWSLAGTRGGAPVMIIRVPRGPASGGWVTITFGDGAKTATLPLTSCDARICLGFLTIEPAIAKELRTGRGAEVLVTRDGRLTTIRTTTAGLAAALKSLR